MNEAQVADIVAYLATIQIPQQEALAEIQGAVNGEMNRLAGADQAMASVIVTQSQLVADISGRRIWPRGRDADQGDEGGSHDAAVRGGHGR